MLTLSKVNWRSAKDEENFQHDLTLYGLACSKVQENGTTIYLPYSEWLCQKRQEKED